MPIRTPATTSTVPSRARSSNGASSSAQPFCACVMPSASVSRPGPEHKSRTSFVPRRRCIAASPSVGSSARIKTALALPAGSHTKFTHQWMPYER